MASIDKQASRIARASFAVAPIIPPLPRGFIRNQNQALSRLQITKSTPKWRLRLDETTLTARTSSIHLRTPSSGFRETRRVLDTYRSEFAAEQRWVTYGILKRGPSPHFARCMTVPWFSSTLGRPPVLFLAAGVGAMFLTSPVFAQDLDLVKGFSDVLGENSPLWR